jgi:hypothetical protein
MSDYPDGKTAAAELSRRAPIVEALAEELHRKMEHLDPTDLPEWEKLNDRQKFFYRACVQHLLLQEGLIKAFLA